MGGYEQEGMSIQGSLFQAARDIIAAPIRQAFNPDTSLAIQALDIGARLLLIAYACYRLGYSRGLTAGIKEGDRRDNDS